jgi:hypothetical protein
VKTLLGQFLAYRDLPHGLGDPSITGTFGEVHAARGGVEVSEIEGAAAVAREVSASGRNASKPTAAK